MSCGEGVCVLEEGDLMEAGSEITSVMKKVNEVQSNCVDEKSFSVMGHEYNNCEAARRPRWFAEHWGFLMIPTSLVGGVCPAGIVKPVQGGEVRRPSCDG